MKAIIYERYGPPEVLRIAEVERPVAGPGQLLVRIHATAVTRFDDATRQANRKSGAAVSALSRLVSGVRRPRQPILGSEFAGEVEAIGEGVTEFAVGDRVFASTGLGLGAYAEAIALDEEARVVPIPRGLTYAEAAALPDGGLNALWCLRQADIGPGTRVLVFGASGAIGTSGVQLAKALGAEVTAVCGPRSVELVRSLGADTVIDHTAVDFTTDGRRYDVIFDAVGKSSFRRCRSSLRAGGRYLATDGFVNLLLAHATRLAGGRRAIFTLPPRYTKQDLVYLTGLVEAGQLRPVLDRVYPFDAIVEATRYVASERKVGNVILAIDAAATDPAG
jgi:NADPH:quinone reductase-like Zn-dependent oxidoreductase